MARKMIAVSDETYDNIKTQAEKVGIPIGAFVALLIEHYKDIKVEWRKDPETPKAQEVSFASLGIRHS